MNNKERTINTNSIPKEWTTKEQIEELHDLIILLICDQERIMEKLGIEYE